MDMRQGRKRVVDFETWLEQHRPSKRMRHGSRPILTTVCHEFAMQCADSKPPLHMELERMLRQDKANLPIILVPCNKQALVNIMNVQDLLQHGIYRKLEKEHLQCFESTRPDAVRIKRNLGGKIWEFEVRDTTRHFTKLMWKRTVAVILDGNDWQFRGWPFATVLDMLTTFKGIYFKESGVNLHEHVQAWACEKLELPPCQLVHRFASIRDEFFQLIENFLNSHRKRMFSNHCTLNDKISGVRMEAVL